MSKAPEVPPVYNVQARDREPLLRFMLDALRAQGCRIIHEPSPERAPFRITFETPAGERMGIIAYAFRATFTPTKNRPADEQSFQLRLGKLWQDPSGLYLTVFLAIDPEAQIFISLDPVLVPESAPRGRCIVPHGAISTIRRCGWLAWEWEPEEGPVQVLVGLRQALFLDSILFEATVQGLDQGHRQLVAEEFPWRTAAAPA
jgi:hypothetical protein